MNDHQTPAGTPPQTPPQTPTSDRHDSPRAVPPADDGADGAVQPRWSSHPVNIRLTIPLLFRNYYVTIVGGPERRSRERRISERKKNPLLVLGNIVVFFVTGTVVGLAALALIQWLAAYTFDSGGAGMSG